MSTDPEPVVPTRSEDDADRGWGDEREESDDAHEEWLRRQVPPHHGE